MSRYVPYPAFPNDAPIDISFVFENEKPAGKHGFLKVDGDRFAFEDGKVERFWGTCINSQANFPDFDYAEKFAKRLAKIGCNIVRFHQLDSEWATPNIFQFTKGKVLKNTQSFDPESMKRLDYLIFCLKNEGIYSYIDMFTYRKFKTGDGVENAHLLKDAAKPYDYFAPRLIELQKKLAYDLWNHVNPYTGLAYKNEPAIVMAEVVNESDFFNFKLEVEPYVTMFRDMFSAWLKENNIDFDAYSCDINDRENPIISEFRIKIYEDHYIDMMNYMKEIGVKIPICGTNHTVSNELRKAQNVCDFNDSHFYFYDWRWGTEDKYCMNTAITEVPDSGIYNMAACRTFGKPLFVSEWDMPWPNEHRAESPILYAAIGALQGWSGYTIHTYAYGAYLENMNMLGKEISASSIGGTAYREGIFSTWNDPAKFGLFYHAALITRRGDVKASDSRVAVKAETMHNLPVTALTAASELRAVGVTYDGVENTCSNIVDENTPLVDLSKGEVISDTGEMYRSWTKNYGTIDSERTKCAYGFLQKNGKIEMNDLSIKSDTDFAVIAMSSLSDDKLSETNNILLTAVGRAKNTNAKFDGDKLVDYGTAPITIEVTEAEIELKTSHPNMKIWAISAEGFYIGCIPSEYDNGVLKFKIGEQFPSMYYLIRVE